MDDKETHMMLGKMLSKLDAVQEDIAEIKDTQLRQADKITNLEVHGAKTGALMGSAAAVAVAIIIEKGKSYIGMQ